MNGCTLADRHANPKCMARIAQIGLISALVLAVLAFGETEPLYFSVVQILLLGLAILLVVSYGTPRVGTRLN